MAKSPRREIFGASLGFTSSATLANAFERAIYPESNAPYKAIAGDLLGDLKNLRHDVQCGCRVSSCRRGRQVHFERESLSRFRERIQERLGNPLRKFLGGTFEHHDVVSVADINQVEIAL